MSDNSSERSNFSLWMQAVRPFSFTASVTPILVGTALAWFEGAAFHALHFAAALFGGVIMHAGTNLASDYFDHRNGADRQDTFGSSRVLVENLMEPRKILYGGLTMFALSFLLGIYLVAEFGRPIVILGLVGLVGGYFYCASPIGYKYRALGEPLVFTLMGPLMVLGAYYVQTGQFSWVAVLVSIPVGILVAAILNANNLRDIPHDLRAGFHTVSSLLGWNWAAVGYRALIAAAFVSLLGLVAFKAAPLWALIALLALPPALKLFKTLGAATPMTPGDLATLDISTAQVHFLFGLLLTVGLILGRLV